MSMYGPITTGAATGGAGVAAATAYSPRPITGVVVQIYVQYNDAPPAGTTDVGIKTKGASGITPSIPLLTITNAATNGVFTPKTPTYTPAGALDGGTAYFVINDIIQVDIAGANDGDSVSVWLETL